MSSQTKYKTAKEVEILNIQGKIQGIKDSLLLFEQHLPTAHQCVKEFLTEYVAYLRINRKYWNDDLVNYPIKKFMY